MLQAFGNWFMSYLRLFRCHQQLWMMRNPTAICGFGVDRARAETLLARQPSVPPRASLCFHTITGCILSGRQNAPFPARQTLLLSKVPVLIIPQPQC